jgi:hypothetical protein
VLGIHEHASPAAAAQMARSACAAASLEEAAAWLRDTGSLEVDVKPLRRITRRFGQRARAALPDNLPVLQVGGTLGGADALFEMLRLYLPLFNALPPARVLLIADGAPWIWTRFTALIEQGLITCPHVVVQLIDFYHAVEHLGAFAEACTFWPRARRIRWRNHARQLLRAGKLETALDKMQALLARRPRSKALRRDLHYFQRNRRRFSYAWARRLRLPIGSGPMESAIRRVINLRLKGPGISPIIS